LIRRLFWILLLVWSVLLVASFLWNWHRGESQILELASMELKGAFEKDLVYRRWASRHGGVYVPVTQDTPPSPYLKHLPERDITTPSGRQLTLVNPAYMTRQVHALGAEQYGLQGHITSLIPIRPENAADSWETKALGRFQRDRSITEYSEVSEIEGVLHLRFMSAMVTEESCLKCHAAQGYQVGEIRGGISVSTPVTQYQSIIQRQVMGYGAIHFGLWVVGASFLAWSFGRWVRAENRIREGKERYRELYDSMADAYVRTRMTGQLVECNKAYREMLGYSDEELRQVTYQDLTPEKWHGVESSIVKRQILTHGHSAVYEKEYRRKDGTIFPVELRTFLVRNQQGEAVAMWAIVRDITERKRAEGALQALNRRQQAILAAIPDILMEVDVHKRYTWANPAGLEFFGDDVVGHEAAEFFEGEQDTYQRVKPLFDGNESRFYVESWQRRRDGKKRLLGWWCQVLKDEAGQVHGALSSARDITDERTMEDQLRQAQKMESIGRLAGGVAHDFNNKLGVILGHADLGMERLPPDHEAVQDLAEIRAAATRSAELTQQLLAFARKQTYTPRVLDLNATVDGMLKMLRRVIGENLQLVWHPERGTMPVDLDPTQLDQVLVNLCVNARDAMPNTGTITIETHSIVLGDAYCRGRAGFVPGEYVLLAVSDNGPGMSKEVLDHIFEPFFTTKGIGKGTGLGLATVYGIVKQNGGFVHAYSEEGTGTTFKIYLPRSSASLSEPVPAEQEIPLSGTETILVVEDEEAILVLAEEVLSRHGYTILSASSPQEALERVRNCEGTIDLLLTDVVMPAMNGRELHEKVELLRPGIKVLYMSGYTANIVALNGSASSGFSFLQKPFSIYALASKVRKVLDG
jgi:PAS domain S-box-containing protein